MPLAQIFVIQGRPKDQLQAAIAGVSQVMSDVLVAPKERLRVWVSEVHPDVWGFMGAPAAVALADRPLAEVETPLIYVHILEGRSAELRHRLIEGISEVVAQALALSRSVVRVAIVELKPDNFGIGGVPAAIVRQAEIKARAEQGG